MRAAQWGESGGFGDAAEPPAEQRGAPGGGKPGIRQGDAHCPYDFRQYQVLRQHCGGKGHAAQADTSERGHRQYLLCGKGDAGIHTGGHGEEGLPAGTEAHGGLLCPH